MTPETPPTTTKAVVGPTRTMLAEKARTVCAERIFECTPSAYHSMEHLWSIRIKAWPLALQTLGTTGGLQLFLNSLSKMYVTTFNNVMAYNPKKSVTDMKVLIGEELYKVDNKFTMNLFKTAWNDAVKQCPDVIIIDTVKASEWNWIVHPLKTACRQAFSLSVRTQLTPKPVQPPKRNFPDKVVHPHYVAE